MTKIKEYLNDLDSFLNKYIYYVFSFYLIVMVFSSSVLVDPEEFSFHNYIILMLSFIKILIFLFFLVKIFFDFLNKRINLIYSSVFIVLVFIVTIFSRNNDLMTLMIIMLGLSNCKFKRILKIYLFSQLLGLILVVLLSAVGVFSNQLFDTSRYRFGLGFGWTTTSSMLFFFILCSYLSIKENSISLSNLSFLFLSSVFIYMLTGSRYVFIIELFLFLMTLFSKYLSLLYNKILSLKIIQYLIVATPWILASLIMGMCYLFTIQNAILMKINDLLSNRLVLGSRALRQYGISIFGQNIIWNGHGTDIINHNIYNFVDSSYLRVLLDNGIIFLVLVLFAYSFFLYKLLIKKQYSILIVLISVLLLSFTEPWLIDVMYNPFVLLGGIVFFRKSKFNDCFQNEGSI